MLLIFLSRATERSSVLPDRAPQPAPPLRCPLKDVKPQTFSFSCDAEWVGSLRVRERPIQGVFGIQHSEENEDLSQLLKISNKIW